MHTRWRTPRVVAVATAAALVAVLGAGTAGTAGAPSRTFPATGTSPAGRYIVRAAADLARAAAVVTAAGGRVVARQAMLGTLVATFPAGAASRLDGDPAVRALSPDRSLPLASLGQDAQGQPGSLGRVADAVHASDLWQRGITGAGVTVALLDTGVAAVPALQGTRVVQGPDLSFDTYKPAAWGKDAYGHGTHMAGIIAGREGPRAPGRTYANDSSRFLGIAPDARLLSLKLADSNGAVDVSQVIAGIDWVVEHAAEYDVRVMNLSFGTPSAQDPLLDPLAFAAQVAVQHGIVVVAAAGNVRDPQRGVADPAYAPSLIAVGASTMNGTAGVEDDQVAPWSAEAGGFAPWRGPDVVAPGVSIPSLAAPGSHVVVANPSAKVGSGLLRGSGTSQAAAVVSGGVALLLQQRPWLTPGQVRQLLRDSAHWIPGETWQRQGTGEIDLAQAADSPAPGPLQVPRTPLGTGRGTLEGARGGLHVGDGRATLTGEVDVMGSPWNATATASATQGVAMWRGSWWNGAPWNDSVVAPTGATAFFGGTTWGAPLSGVTLSGRTWTASGWVGRTWTAGAWTAGSWVGRTWTGVLWEADTTSAAYLSKQWGTASWS